MQVIGIKYDSENELNNTLFINIDILATQKENVERCNRIKDDIIKNIPSENVGYYI